MYYYLLLEELPTVAGVITLPDAPALMLVRARPGLGPQSRHTALLNASLPAPAAVVTISGSTLPMMGVG
jgi:hypothetical protein